MNAAAGRRSFFSCRGHEAGFKTIDNFMRLSRLVSRLTEI